MIQRRNEATSASKINTSLLLDSKLIPKLPEPIQAEYGVSLKQHFKETIKNWLESK